MFDALGKYKETSHFFFGPNDILADLCNAPCDKSGVYIIYTLASGKVELIYIGSSGKKLKDGTLKTRKAGLGGIKDRLANGKQFGDRLKITWPLQIKLEHIEVLDIYWWVTHGDSYTDCPVEVEGSLLRKYKEVFRRLPRWNKK